MGSQPPHLNANVERFSGFAELYDSFRPKPPYEIVNLLVQLSASARPALVVDIASGTGLSTVIWCGRAAEIVGIEPNPDMREEAARRLASIAHGGSAVRFVDGVSTATGLKDASADIVTVSQALHWMEPEPSFAEIARILRPGGIFAAYDCDWPPTFNREVEQAYGRCMDHAQQLERQLRTAPEVRKWSKDAHLSRVRDSRRFSYVKEAVFHHLESGGAERIVGLALSQGMLAGLLKHGLSEEQIGVEALRETARRVLGDAIVPWYWSYRVRIGIK
jgi:ubiquinone/menaquinone biosynthesis C-methylase UbiE